MKHSKNNFRGFLPALSITSFFLNPTDGIKIKSMSKATNPLKSIYLNTVTIKILKLLIIEFSSQLAELFNLFFYWYIPINTKS